MKKILAFLLVLLASPVAIADYEVGQVWTYKTRPGEESSRLYIARIDDDGTLDDGTPYRIFHIYVDGLNMQNRHVESGIQKVLPHAPVDEVTLDSSVIDLIDTSTVIPDISEGYAEWTRAVEVGYFFVHSISVQEIVEDYEEFLNQ